MYNRLHTIPACDGQTDEQTDGQTGILLGIVRAMHTRRAVKIMKNKKYVLSHLFNATFSFLITLRSSS